MTFHAGNGVTLSKEEENLPEEEKQKLIRQKEEQLHYERHVDDDLKEMVERGDMAGLEAERKRLDKELGKPRSYGLDGADLNHEYATKISQELEDERLRRQEEIVDDVIGKGKRPDAQTKGSPAGGEANAVTPSGLGDGAFGTLKNEDFTQYRKEKAARQAAAREARMASAAAMAAKRDELLASGQYFDNGRGEILLKKQYRQYVTGDRRHRHLRTAADDGSGMAAIRGAGQSTWDEALRDQAIERTEGAVGYSRSAIQANRLAAEERKAARAEAAATSAKARLSVFDGFAAALDALNADASSAEDNVVSVWGGKDEKDRDARWKYDERGRVIGQADARQVVRGKKLASGGVQQTEGGFRKGFVDPVVLKAINSQLQKRGADYAITGIMARQAYGAIGKPVEGSKPMFYIQGLRNDGTQFGQYMTIDDVYRWGVENYRAANGENGDADRFAIEALGGYNPEKVEKRQKDGGGMSEERMQLERDRLAQRQQEEQGRNARAGAKNSGANARLAASVAKNMGDIKRGLRLSDEQAASFQTSLTKILSDAFSPQDESGGDEEKGNGGGGETKGGTRTIKGYRYNKDRSKRIPVYDDGTQGEPEMVGGGAAE